MARRRYISTKISLDVKINKLAMTAGDFAAMLYTWMIPHAEDDGRLTGDLDELLMTVCPGRRDKSPEDIAAALHAMHDLGLVEWNQDAGYVQFPASFYGYQSYITDKRKGPQGQDTPEENINTSAKQRKTAQNATSSSLLVSSSSSVSLKSPIAATPSEMPPKIEPTAPSLAPEAANAAPARKREGKPDVTKPIEQIPKNRNPHWDALVEVIGHGPAPSKVGAWGKAIHDIKLMQGTPDDIRIRAPIYRQRFPSRDEPMSPTALAGSWHDCEPYVSPTTKSKEIDDEQYFHLANQAAQEIADELSQRRNRATA